MLFRDTLIRCALTLTCKWCALVRAEVCRPYTLMRYLLLTLEILVRYLLLKLLVWARDEASMATAW